MALQKTVTTPQGFSATSAYHRVESVSLPAKTRMEFIVRSYKNKEAGEAFATEFYTAPYDVSGDNPIAQAYTHLKALPAFKDAKEA